MREGEETHQTPPRYARGAPLKPALVVMDEEVVMCCVNSFL